MNGPEVIDDYTRNRIDRIEDDTAATRATLREIKKDLADGRKHFESQDDRLRGLERAHARIVGIGAAVSALLGMGIGALGWLKR